ncbi:MAG: c-type cytochrome biogenesis protein CcmI [Dokdonella sp.]
MTMFLMITTLMIVLALAIVLIPLLRGRRIGSGKAEPNSRRLRALDDALAADIISAEEYAAKRALLDAVPVTTSSGSNASHSVLVAVLAVVIVLPASAIVLYRAIGSPQSLDPAQVAAPAADAATHGVDMDQAIIGLAEKMEKNPGDPQGWALLGRAYQSTGKFAEARDAFKRALDLLPNDPDVMVEYAQALAMAAAPDQPHLDGESRTLIDKALTINADNQRGLWLRGVSEYQAQEFPSAIATWSHLLTLLQPDSDVAKNVQSQITDARLQAGMPAAATATIAAEKPASPASAASATDAPHLTVHVSLDPKLASQLDPNASLFVFARAANGPPMPLAVQHLSASQLPLTVTLDDSNGMLPTMKLSMFPQVVIGARISKTGNALPQSGDMQALSAPTDVHRTETVALTIADIVP